MNATKTKERFIPFPQNDIITLYTQEGSFSEQDNEEFKSIFTIIYSLFHF